MENIYAELESAAKAKGTNLTKICRAANVARSVPARWKDNEPKTITLYRKLKKAIDDIKEPLKTVGEEVC